MDEYLRCESPIFCLSNCNIFEILCSQPVFITEFFTFFLFLIMYLQLSIPHCIVNKVPSTYPLSSTLCLNLIIRNITPGGLFSGELIHGRSFPFQKLVPKRPGAYTGWGLLSEFYGMFSLNFNIKVKE